MGWMIEQYNEEKGKRKEQASPELAEFSRLKLICVQLLRWWYVSKNLQYFLKTFIISSPVFRI